MRGDHATAYVSLSDVARPVGGHWLEELWLGKRFHSEEHIVMNVGDGAIVRTHSVQEMPQKLDQSMVDKIDGTSWAPLRVAHQEGVIPRPVLRDTDHHPENTSRRSATEERKNSFGLRGEMRQVLGQETRRLLPTSFGPFQGVQVQN